MSAKRLLIFVCACSTALLLLSPANAVAQHGGGGHGGSGGGPAPSSGGGHGGGPGPSNGHGGYPSGGYPSGGYRPYYGGYHGYYHPYYTPYFYNGFYASFYYGLGWYPYYWSFAYGNPWGYYGYYGYPCCGYPYPGYAYSAWASARLEMKPREAQVFVDGYYVGVVNDFDGVFQRLDLPTGQHELAVYLPGYQTWKQQVMFQPGEGYHYKGELQQLPPGAPEDPRPQPSPNAQPNNGYGQQGYGGQPGYGQPGYGQQGGYGQPAYPPHNGNPNGGMYPYPPNGVDPGQPQPMPQEHPNGAPASGFGTLNLRVQPGDAVVQIDGEKWDNPDGGSRLVVQLAAGPHRIEVRKDGYRPYSTTIQIRPGEPQAINVVLPQGD